MSFYGRSIPKSNNVKPAPSDHVFDVREQCWVCASPLTATSESFENEHGRARVYECSTNRCTRIWRSDVEPTHRIEGA